MSPFTLLAMSSDSDRIQVPGYSPIHLINRAALRGQLTPPATKPKPAEFAAKPAAIVPNKSAPVGSRQWAAGMLKEFGKEAGARYVGLELTYMEALDLACAEHKKARGLTPVAGEADRPQAKGFVSRVRFTPGLQIFGRRRGSVATDPSKS